MPETRTFVILAALALVLPACVKSNSSSSPLSTDSATKRPVIEPVSGGKMVRLAGGQFTMGDPRGGPSSVPHQVVVDSFYIDCYPVTQRLYQAVMKTNPSKWKSPDNPVEQLQWIDAARFCNRCSELEGLQPCYDPATWECDFAATGYRLPTEAEWEYACRAGTRSRYSFGADPADMPKYGVCKPQSRGRPHPVGSRRPNPWGLFDMHGNVWQWCNDFYSPTYFAQSPRKNPRGPRTGKQRVLRGGSWKSSADACRSARRHKEFPVFTDACFGADSYGFRRVRGGNAVAESSGLPPKKTPVTPEDLASEPEHPSAPEDMKPLAAQPPASPVESKTPPAAVTIDPARLNGSIVFVSDRNGALDIWKMKPDGTQKTQLTKDAHADADPRFSPDGRNLLYTSLRDGFPEIWTMGSNGSGAKRLTEGSQAAWSPDGRSIVFIRDDQVFVRQLDTSAERRVTPGDWNRCGVPAWSPDGIRIALASRHQGTIGIFLLNPRGSNQTRLPTEDPCCTPAWSPDGKRILFQTVKGHIHELQLESGQEEQLTFGADVQHDARYSPDGTLVAFCRAPTEDGPWQICILDLDSDDLDWIQITHEESNRLPDWCARDAENRE